jgi:hypothetical protein
MLEGDLIIHGINIKIGILTVLGDCLHEIFIRIFDSNGILSIIIGFFAAVLPVHLV